MKNNLELNIDEFLFELKKKFKAIEIDKNEQYIEELCKKNKNPITLEIKDKKVLSSLFTTEEKELNKYEKERNIKNKQLKTYYNIITGNSIIIIVENLDGKYEYSIRVVGNSSSLLGKLLKIRRIH